MKINRTDGENITPELLNKLIRRYENEKERFVKQRGYYLGKHAIQGRTCRESGSNNKIVCNHAKYIVDMTTAYLCGVPITYSASEDVDIEKIKDCYFSQSISSLDALLEKEASICGRAYEIVYANDEAQPSSCLIPSEQAFIVYDDSVSTKKLFGVYYYNHINVDGSRGKAEVVVYDDKNVYTYTSSYEDFSGIELKETQAHYFGAVPMIEYKNNSERQGDFEQQISLIDAYNTLMSDRVNDKEQFVDSFLLLLGIEVDTDQAKKLKKEKILMGDTDGRAEYLSKVLDEADTEILRQTIKEDIQRFSMVPDLTDESFGGNLSGVAIKYKLLGFEQHIKNKERYFEAGLKERFSLYNHFFNIKNNMPIIPTNKIDIEFKRTLPVNELEIAQMISMLGEVVSRETLLSTVPFVSDPKEENKLLEIQKKKDSELKQTGLDDMAMSGFSE